MTEPISRRGFMRTAAVSAAGVAAFSSTASTGEYQGEKRTFSPGKFASPVTVSTWTHGQRSGQVALGVLREGGAPIDAVEQGINVVERDPEVTSVGLGGLPNQDGVVELDAAIMTGELRCGSVSGLRQIATPISVARKVMEKTRHIQLVGEGALRFALEQGFKKEELLTPGARARWEKWLASANRPVPPQIDPDGKEKTHDTVTTLALGTGGAMAAGCSTSGLAWKLPGRVGDSPIVGAGLYCDGAVGAAGATGIGEEILRVCGSFLVVEGMRRGLSPQEAIQEVLRRVIACNPENRQRQVAFIALSRQGEVGAGAMVQGFQVAISSGSGTKLFLDVPAFE